MKEPVIIAERHLAAGEAPDVSFVPPLLRRRLSPLQRIFFHLANFKNQPKPKNIVFASRDGEDTLTRRTVADYCEDGTVSAQRFSSSVYNAAPGLWSIFTGNAAPYTAIAAGVDSERCGKIETLAAGIWPALFVYAEETDGGHGYAILYGAPD